jgi:hypothetical protein
VNAYDFKPVDMSEQSTSKSEGVVEIQLLLSFRHLAKLAITAHQHRMTVAELVRRLIYDFVTTPPASR